jgi:hypothetical protein
MHASFEAIMAPLERATGQTLNGKNRQVCVAAFAESPDGFGACAAKALRIAHSTPIGLLVRLVKDGEHRRTVNLRAADDTSFERWVKWATRTAPLLPADVREEVLADLRLAPHELAHIRELLAGLEEAA